MSIFVYRTLMAPVFFELSVIVDLKWRAPPFNSPPMHCNRLTSNESHTDQNMNRFGSLNSI